MNKLTFSFFVFAFCLLSSCSENNDPWIGEWKPAEGNDDGTIELLPNGALVYSQDSSEGDLVIYGAWEKDPEAERTVYLQFDPSTIKVHADNPIVEYVLAMGAQVLCSERLTFIISEDGKYATGTDKYPDGFVKVSDGSCKYDDLKPHVYEAPEVAVQEDEVAEEVVAPDNRNYNLGDYPIAMEGETIQLYKGNIGEYPIVVEYVQVEESDVTGDIEINGRYQYTEAGNVLDFSGVETAQGTITLDEVTKSGKHSGKFALRRSGNALVGTFTNLINGNVFDVTLRRE